MSCFIFYVCIQVFSLPLRKEFFFLFTGLHLAVKIITGDLKKCQTEHPMLFTKGLAVIQKMDFSDVINPGNTGCLLWSYIGYHLMIIRALL